MGIFCISLVYPKTPLKNRFIIGVDGLSSLDSNKQLTGILFHGGYNLFSKKINFISIEPKIGVGYFEGKKENKFNSTPISNYKINCISGGLSPKLNLALNPDENAFIFLENDFSVMNVQAKINDKGSLSTRTVNENFIFYYTIKVGLIFQLSKRSGLGLWVGGTTLKFDDLLNKGVPLSKEHYSSEAPSYCIGISLYL